MTRVMSDATPAEHARALIDALAYMTLATADEEGRPWASPVWFAHRDHREFIWISRPDTRHSRNLAVNPRLAISIYDSTVVPDDAAVVYIEAEGAEVADAGKRAALLEVFSRRSVAQGLGPFGEEDVTGPAPHRLYRAQARATFVLGPRDQRIEVT
jgi:nitroimidazol reductase NimA-like FMN-containing flavoprotein (pyridoxamine 5'-phosphate oxidase superfamily)